MVHASNPKIVVVIQARMGSTRLPGKVLQSLAGRPVLEWMVRVARQAHGVDDVVVATSSAAGDDRVAELGNRLGVRVVRGSEDDVLARFVQASAETGADAIVRLTADCPLADPRLIDQVTALWRAEPSLDYVATTLVRTLPRGLDVELVSAQALARADQEATGYHRVHVTSYLYAGPRRFDTVGIVVQPAANDLRVTLDTSADLDAIMAIVAELGDRPPRWQDVVGLLRTRPDLVALNAAVEQKELSEG